KVRGGLLSRIGKAAARIGARGRSKRSGAATKEVKPHPPREASGVRRIPPLSVRATRCLTGTGTGCQSGGRHRTSDASRVTIPVTHYAQRLECGAFRRFPFAQLAVSPARAPVAKAVEDTALQTLRELLCRSPTTRSVWSAAHSAAL